MGKDTTAFRERFNAYKNGKSVSEIYDAGLPRYAGGKRGYIGGSTKHARETVWNTDQTLSNAVDSIANAYLLKDGLLLHRLNEEGFTDKAIRLYNNAGNQSLYTGENLLNNKTDFSGVGDFGLDDAGTMILNNQMLLKGENWWDEEGENEQGRITHGAVGDTVRDTIGLQASALKYFSDLVKKDYPNLSDYDNARYTQAYYQRGVGGGRKWAKAGAKGYNFSTKPLTMRPAETPYLLLTTIQSTAAPKFGKYANGKLPLFRGGKGGYVRLNGNDIKFDEETGELIDQITGERGTLMLPEINITRANPDNYRSSYDPNAVINGFNALTLGGLNNLDPTQWARRAYDLPKTLFGPMKFSTYMNRWINGNEGVVSNQFSSLHPYYSAIINMLAGGAGVLSGRIINQLKPSNLGKHFYYNVNPQGYDNIIKQSKDIAKTILKGSEPDIENPRWDVPGAFAEGANSYGIPEDVFRRARIDAWRMYTNLPQKYNTFVPHKNIPGVYTSKNDINRIMDLDIIEDPNFLKMLREKEGVGTDVFNGSGGNVGFKNVKLGKTIEGDDLGVLITDDVWDIQPFSRIDYGGGLGSRITEHTTNKILKKILPLQLKISKKLDNASYIDDVDGFKKWAAEHPYEAEYSDPRDLFSKKRKIKPVLDAVNTVLHKSTTKLSDFDRWLRKTLNDKGRNFEVGSLYKGSPFRVINEFPYTKATNWNMLKYPNRDDWYSYWGGFTTKNILPTDAWNYTHKGILPMDDSKYIIPTQIPFK